jgi:hypothetical protein
MISIFSTSAFSRGDEVGNGSGLYENRTGYIFNSLDQFIGQALIHGELNSFDTDFLNTILNNFKTIAKETKISFKAEDPSFLIDGEYRVAMTGENLNSKIIFNIDKLYLIPPMELTQTLISILVHELGHKIGEHNHFYLDYIGAKVANHSIKDSTVYYTDIIEKTEYIEVISFFDEEISDRILFVSDDRTFDINILIEEKNFCDGSYNAFNFHKDVNSKSLEGLLLFKCNTPEGSTIQPIQISKSSLGFVNDKKIMLEFL